MTNRADGDTTLAALVIRIIATLRASEGEIYHYPLTPNLI